VTATFPDGVTVSGVELLSLKRLDWQVSKDVPDIAVKGDVGTLIVD
jgi:hypothetical protein